MPNPAEVPPENGGADMTTRRSRVRLLGAVAGATVVAASALVAVTGGGAAEAAPVAHSLGTNPTSLDLGAPPLGTYNGPVSFTLTNNGGATDTIGASPGDVTFSGPGADDYGIASEPSCPGTDTTIVLTAGASCVLDVYFFPGALGPRDATLSIKGSTDTTPTVVQLSGSGETGYYQVDQFGDVAYAGDASYVGDAGNLALNRPIVAITPTGNNGGYWLVASDGGIFSYGDATFYGSTGNIHLNQPIVGMARTWGAGGYWMVASDGGIFSYGNASFYGSTGGMALNKPIVGMAVTPDNKGYWLVASDGGIFSFGDATFYGSAGNIVLNKPIVGMAATPDGRGYWLVASDGGIFSYGDARFYGSAGNILLNQPIVSMAAMPDGGGYWFSAVDGGLFNYGTAPFYGSGVGLGLGPIVDMAVNGGPTVEAVNDLPALRHGEVRHTGIVRRSSLALPVPRAADVPAAAGRALSHR